MLLHAIILIYGSIIDMFIFFKYNAKRFLMFIFRLLRKMIVVKIITGKNSILLQ